MWKEYRILPVRVPMHGLKDTSLLSDILGYELFKRDGIKLVSLGVYDSEEIAKRIATKNASPANPKFV